MKARIDKSKIQTTQNKVDEFIGDDKEIFLQVGDKVKLNYIKITHHPDYKKLRESYKKFVKENKEKIFTLEEDKNHKNSIAIFSFKEDTTTPKWLFAEPDLILIEKVKR